MTDSPITRLACPSCGGLLPVPLGQSEFVTCPFCSTNLHVRRTASSIGLEVTQAIGQAVATELIRAQRKQELSTQMQQVQLAIKHTVLDASAWDRALPSLSKRRALNAIKQQRAVLERQYQNLLNEYNALG
jgi:uncharacterized Zn finger protein (UPF0148 family)